MIKQSRLIDRFRCIKILAVAWLRGMGEKIIQNLDE